MAPTVDATLDRLRGNRTSALKASELRFHAVCEDGAGLLLHGPHPDVVLRVDDVGNLRDRLEERVDLRWVDHRRIREDASSTGDCHAARPRELGDRLCHAFRRGELGFDHERDRRFVQALRVHDRRVPSHNPEALEAREARAHRRRAHANRLRDVPQRHARV